METGSGRPERYGCRKPIFADEIFAVGAARLKQLGFPDDVTEPIRLHVPAKRYLCAVDPSYWAALSDGSKKSLELQGGVMSMAEARAFERDHGQFGADAATLRRWEDEGKTMFRTGEREPVAWSADVEASLRSWIGASIGKESQSDASA